MKIELTKKQYKALVTMLYCGDWLLNSYKSTDDKVQKETEEVEQLIYSFAKEAGLEKWFEYDKDMDTYFPTADMDDDMFDFIDTYNNRQLDL